MNLDKNIENAFLVVHKTYENVDKLLKYCDSIAYECGYEVITDKFLRYKSDPDYHGWGIRSFTKLYQSLKDGDKMEQNGWRDAPIYTFEINFEAEPILIVSKFEYEDMSEWSSGLSSGDYWAFYYPTCDGDERFEHIEVKEDYNSSIPKDGISDKYWGLKRAVYKVESLVLLTRENVKDLIFNEFDKMTIL